MKQSLQPQSTASSKVAATPNRRRLLIAGGLGAVIVVALILTLARGGEGEGRSDEAAHEVSDAVTERLREIAPPPEPAVRDDGPGNLARPAGQ